MAVPSLAQLKRSYSAALYSYFRVTNLKESFEVFKEDPTTAPTFYYAPSFTESNIDKRLRKLHKILSELDPSNEAEIAFVEWRIAESVILKKFLKIRNHGGIPTKKEVDDYLAAQVELYGEVDERMFYGVVRSIRILAHRRGERFNRHMKKIDASLANYQKEVLFSPKEETFQHYKHLFSQCFPELHHVLAGVRKAEAYTIEEVANLFKKALAAVGADKKGWKVRFSDGGANIIAAKYSKTIIIGNQFHPRSTLRLKQIIAHEVGCHVQRALTDRQAKKFARLDENDEGLAVMLEQLFADRFMHKRALRYLGIALATGADGRKRNFVEVYDILWRAAYIINGSSPAQAKEQAFYETARAFRGGLPNVAGMVYIKDKIYLEGNIMIWQKLQDHLLDLPAFRRLFRGHNNKLAKEIVP